MSETGLRFKVPTRFRLPEWLEGICPSQLLRQTKGLLSRPSKRLVFVSARLCNLQCLFIQIFIPSMRTHRLYTHDGALINKGVVFIASEGLCMFTVA